MKNILARSVPLAFSLLSFGLLSSIQAQNYQPALTIYNQNFAVVRQSVPLQLKAGANRVSLNGVTASLEPDSVVLRDPQGRYNLQILEQNYRADALSQERLLDLFEGKTIPFRITQGDRVMTVPGQIVRSGYVPPITAPQGYPGYPNYYNASAQQQPIIKINGTLRFGLPGQPLFPALGNDTILKPTLNWLLHSPRAGKLNAELGYVTGGLSWSASYNLVLPENSERLDLVGWITMNNRSGKVFSNAKIKLMAGDVSKLQQGGEYGPRGPSGAMGERGMAAVVTEKAFEDYHLYTLARPATLRDAETKQVEFVRGKNVLSHRIYVYDAINNWPRNNATFISDPSYSPQLNTKVWAMREFANSASNGLGVPLPRGRLRFYRRDSDGQLEFIGENVIDHTPKNETVRVYTGNAFDIVGARKRLDLKVQSNDFFDETFEIKVRNHKSTPATVRVVEHLYRWINWSIKEKSDEFVKTDAQTIEFRVIVPPDSEKTITYTVHYTWR